MVVAPPGFESFVQALGTIAAMYGGDTSELAPVLATSHPMFTAYRMGEIYEKKSKKRKMLPISDED